ncbi:hypothetical protein BTHE_1532 [Bifidobacterium thermophilum]|nr:hypothetical protein BTHE_1532 [Bifidobacterium thermophilum]
MQRHLAVPVGSPIRNLESGRTSSTTSRKSERFSHSPSSRHYGNPETYHLLPIPVTRHQSGLASRTTSRRNTRTPQSPITPRHRNLETSRHSPIPVGRPPQNLKSGRASDTALHRSKHIL